MGRNQRPPVPFRSIRQVAAPEAKSAVSGRILFSYVIQTTDEFEFNVLANFLLHVFLHCIA